MFFDFTRIEFKKVDYEQARKRANSGRENTDPSTTLIPGNEIPFTLNYKLQCCSSHNRL